MNGDLTQSDPRAAILTWLDAAEHGELCPSWTNSGGEIDDETCDCDLGKMRAAMRAVLDEHREHFGLNGLTCESCDVEPCPTVAAVASALGVTT